jgi:large subunit ribosomal protein L18
MKSTRETGRRRRHQRVRRRILAAPGRVRLTVFRSQLHIYAQIVDDAQGRTLVAASSLKLEAVPRGEGESKMLAQAKAVGLQLAARAKEKGIVEVAFDRSGYRYHGRVAALAQGARAGGLQF